MIALLPRKMVALLKRTFFASFPSRQESGKKSALRLTAETPSPAKQFVFSFFRVSQRGRQRC